MRSVYLHNLTYREGTSDLHRQVSVARYYAAGRGDRGGFTEHGRVVLLFVSCEVGHHEVRTLGYHICRRRSHNWL